MGQNYAVDKWSAAVKPTAGNAVVIAFLGSRRTLPPSNTLPLAFGATQQPEKPKPQPKPKKRNPPVLDIGAAFGRQSAGGVCLSAGNRAAKSAHLYPSRNGRVADVSGCLNVVAETLADVLQDSWLAFTAPASLSGCLNLPSQQLARLRVDDAIVYPVINRLNGCTTAEISAILALQACANPRYSGSLKTAHCAVTQQIGKPVASCGRGGWRKGAITPCEWYPIVLPNTPDNGKTPKPAGNAVPLDFWQKRQRFSPRELPIPFGKRSKTRHIPPLDNYIMLNKITARSGSLKLNPLSAGIKADMAGYCWLGEITLPPDDFAALGLDNRIGSETEITLDINGNLFVFMAENVSDNRQFANRSYTVSGRSLTAKLGADYAAANRSVITQNHYASQIAQMQVADLGFTLDWRAADWLIPADVYNPADKTPIAVIQDLAAACGAFVYSHPSEPKLTVLPRWQVGAWEIKDTAAAVNIPANIILQISGQKTVATQCHGVFAWGTVAPHAKGASIVRNGTDGTPLAGALSHAVYTDLIPCQAAGIAALSDSGTHKTETLTLPLAESYGLGVATLGAVWQIAEPSGAWQGRVTGVVLSVAVENEVPVIKQTVTVDRYLGT